MSDNPLDLDAIEALLRSDRAAQQRRQQEDADLERQRRRDDELRAAFMAVSRFTPAVFDTQGYQKGELTAQEFIDQWADLWITLGDQLRDKREFLTRQPEDLRDEPGDAPRTIALAVLRGRLRFDHARIIRA
jgi:hypothetical protein